MSVEEKNFSGDMSNEKLITYKRRRVYNENPDPQEVGPSYTKRKRKTKEKDIVWYHVGHREVLRCPNVPDQVAEEISRHLFLNETEMPLLNLNWNGKKKRKAGRTRLARQVQEKITEVDEMNSDPAEYENDEPEKDLEAEMLQKTTEDKMQCGSFNCTAETQENTNYEVLKNPNDKTERHSQVNNDTEGSNNGNHWKSWRNILQSMLPLSDGNEIKNSIGLIGVHGCIRRALSLPGAYLTSKVRIHVSPSEESIDPYQGRYCNHCRHEIFNNWGLISCKGCDISYHTSCINPVIHDSTKSWYCSACISRKPDMPINIGPDDADCEEEGNAETVQPCITSMYRLCKLCGTRADKREFVVCSHPECSYKYYHTRCLKKSRVAISMQEDNTCWFCPSCLCRVCRDNKDDLLLVLCDGCDEGHHIYCMDPPCDSVPVGKWYCGKCKKKRKKKGRKTETDMHSLGSKRFKKNGVVPSLILINNGTKIEDKKQAHQSMDVLMSAIDTVSAQEKLPKKPVC